MSSPAILNEMPYERNKQDRQLGWTNFVVRASVADRATASVVSRELTTSAGTPRLARAWFTHFTISPSIYVAVLAAAGAGCETGPTAKPRKAIRAATSRMLERGLRRESPDMARSVTATSSSGTRTIVLFGP